MDHTGSDPDNGFFKSFVLSRGQDFRELIAPVFAKIPSLFKNDFGFLLENLEAESLDIVLETVQVDHSLFVV